MIKLTAKLPRSVFIDGAGFAIDTDYRIMADFETKINNSDISDKKILSDIIYETITALFGRVPDKDPEKVIKAMLWYYRCGKEIPAGRTALKKRCYDYDIDSDMIYSAFMQQYGDDLINSDMHWWEFRAKFLSLTDDTEFVKIMQYRCADISKIKDPGERERIRKLQAYFSLERQRQKIYPDLKSRDDAIRSKLVKRFEEVKKQASEKDRRKE